MKRMKQLGLWASALALALAACQPAATPAPTTAPEQPTEASAPDKLATILARGTLVISTDPAYPPQSELNPDGQRAAETKCAADQQTAGQLRGFDVDVAVAIAEGLGVEPCFVSPSWDLITAGNWSDRWDISVGSMTITPERAQLLLFGQPYYTTPAAVFVHADNTSFTAPADLSGRTVGVGVATTYEAYLNGNLVIPGETIDFVIENATIETRDTDTTALQDLALGDGVRLDAVITAQPTGEGFIADGQPIKLLGEPIYFEYLAPAFDRNASQDQTSLVARVNEIIAGLHSDGTLQGWSDTYYGTDLTSAAAAFDTSGVNNP